MAAKKPKAETPKATISGAGTVTAAVTGKRGDAHDRIDALIDLLDRNGISVPEGLR